jgi:hypothetical protein
VTREALTKDLDLARELLDKAVAEEDSVRLLGLLAVAHTALGRALHEADWKVGMERLREERK